MMALVTTFITCPLIARFYPPIYYKRTDKLDKQGSPLELGMDNQFNSIRVCIYAECVDSVSRLCKFVKLMRSDANNVELNVIRTVESNETMASVIGAANATEIDPVLKTAEVLGDFIGVPTTCFLETSEYEKIGEVLHDLARMEKYNFLLIRWSQCGFINLTLINEIFIAAPITTAILIEPTALGKSVFDQTDRLEILVPFVGGLNDRKAVSLAVSLSSPNGVRVRILRFLKSQIRPSKSLPKIVEKAFSNSINTENATPEDLEDDQLIKKVKLESNPKMEVLVISTEESANIEQAIGQEYMGSCYNLIIMGKPMIFYEKENSFTPDNNYRSKVLSRKHSETIKARLLHQTSVHSHNSAFWESPDYIFGKTASRLMGTVTCPILVIREPFVNKPDLL